MISAELREAALELVDLGRRPHVEAAAVLAVELARRWDVNEYDAEIAALLHDCTKRENAAGQLNLCAKYGIIPTQIELREPSLLHARTGAAVAADVFGVSPAVADAICTHTTGAPGMTALQIIIYLADALEPTRTISGLEELRALAFSDLEAAATACAARTLSYLCGKGLLIDIATVETYNALICKKEKHGKD